MDFRSPIARARGLGSAHHGVDHWWRQRITALLLLPLGLWLAVSLALLPAVSVATARHWVSTPLNALLLLTFIGAACYHAALGMQVILEDYVATRWVRVCGLLAVQGLLSAAALVSAFAVLHLTFGN